MYWIDPIALTDESLLPGTTVAEDATPAWASGTYAVGDLRHVVATHRVYQCVQAGQSTTSPDKDPTRWVDLRPTNRWAPFDMYTKLTAAESTAQDLVYEISARYCTALALDGLDGAGVVVEVLDGPGGAVVYRYPGSGQHRLITAARGYWDYAYGRRQRVTQLLLYELPMLPKGVVRITISGQDSQRRAVGLITLGALRQLHGVNFGGVLRGASVEPQPFTYRPRREDGTLGPITIRPGTKTRTWQVFIGRERADAALRTFDALTQRPAYVMATLKPGFDGLMGFGFLARGKVDYDNRYATCDVSLEDLV